MQLKDLTKRVTEMSDEQLKAHIQEIRHNKYVAKPAVQKRKADIVKKEHNRQTSTVNKLVGGMSDAEKAALIQLLGGEDAEG